MPENSFWYLAYLRAKTLWSNEEFINYQRLLMQQVKNMLNAKDFPKQGEVFTMPSMTVPDQSLTVRELMDRFARGLPLGGAKVPIWEGEDDNTPDFSKMDLSEIEDYQLQVQAELEEIRERMNAKSKKADSAKEIAELKEQLAKLKVAEKINETNDQNTAKDAEPK